MTVGSGTNAAVGVDISVVVLGGIKGVVSCGVMVGVRFVVDLYRRAVVNPVASTIVIAEM